MRVPGEIEAMRGPPVMRGAMRQLGRSPQIRWTPSVLNVGGLDRARLSRCHESLAVMAWACRLLPSRLATSNHHDVTQGRIKEIGCLPYFTDFDKRRSPVSLPGARFRASSARRSGTTSRHQLAEFGYPSLGRRQGIGRMLTDVGAAKVWRGRVPPTAGPKRLEGLQRPPEKGCGGAIAALASFESAGDELGSGGWRAYGSTSIAPAPTTPPRSPSKSSTVPSRPLTLTARYWG